MPVPDVGSGLDAGPMDAAAAPDVAPGVDSGSTGDSGGAVDGGPAADGGPRADGGPVGACTGAEILCDAVCTDVSSSAAHCGACGSACAPGQACVAGTCGGMASCPPGTLDCGGECRDVSGDPEFCGSCLPVACGDAELCVDGVCTCRPGLRRCGADCVDLSSDPANCGGCGAPCATVCTGGVCGDPGSCTGDVCGGACVDLGSDPFNCGACGNACAVDQICVRSVCYDYEPPVGCTSCAGCDVCPRGEPCCEVPGYGPSCIARDAC